MNQKMLSQAIEKLSKVIPNGSSDPALLIEEAADIIEKYNNAARYPATDQKHLGASTATQLVYAQMMREKIEAELLELKAKIKKIGDGM